MIVYEGSRRLAGNAEYFICRSGETKYLGVSGPGKNITGLYGVIAEINGKTIKLCTLNNANAAILREIFSFAKPIKNNNKNVSIGLGDRLGLASAGHIRAIKEHDIFPVLAQQSMRELKLTGRTYEDVLAAATFAVFQEGYAKGYGADGDHLKTKEEVSYALKSGYTMITLDCSEHIVNDLADVDIKYEKIAEKRREGFERKYLGREFMLGSGKKIVYDPDDLKKAAVMYLGAIDHIIEVFTDQIKARTAEIDFEISIDETASTTSPQDHFFVASELKDNGIAFTSLAPRFCGEFQKGIDYIGNIERFKNEFHVHAQIAETFGYRVSIHSGSDKFSIFSYIGEYTGRRFHLKTAGTSWLQAVRTISVYDPDLYRKIHKYAIIKINEAKKYYHISADIKNLPDLDELSDEKLKDLMEMNDTRQLIHITYGQILQNRELKTEIYGFLHLHEDNYNDFLVEHIGRHIRSLGLQAL